MASNFSTNYSDPENGISFAKRQDDMLDLDAIIEQLGMLESQLSYRESEIQATADAGRMAERSVRLDEELNSVLQELNDLQTSGDYSKNCSDSGSVEPSSPILDDGDLLHSSYATLNGVQPSFPCSESKSSFGTLSSQNSHSSGVSTGSGKSAQTLVRVYSTDGSCKTVAVDDQTTVGKVCEVLAKKNRVEMPLNWAIVEYIPVLHMERILEDHLLVLDQLNLWTKDSKNRLVFTEKPEKYSIFNNPELRDAAAKDSYSPDVDGFLYFKLDGKKTWKKIFFVLRASGLYYNPKGKGKSASDLICLQPLKGFDFYFGLDWKKYYKAPTEYGFAIKMPMIQKEVPKFIRFFCLEDKKTLMDWATAFRLVKHGSQLHGSFVRTQSWIASLKHMRQTKLNPHSTPAPSVHQSSGCRGISNGSSLSDDKVLSDTESDVVFTHSRQNSTEYGTLKKSVPNLPITTSLTRHLSIQQQNFARTLPRSSARSASRAGSREDASPKLPSNDGSFMKFPSPDFSLDREDVEAESGFSGDVLSGFLRSPNGAPLYATQSLRNRTSPNKYQTLNAVSLQKARSPNFRSAGGGERLPPTIPHSQSSGVGFGSRVSPGDKLHSSKSLVQDASNSLDDVFDSYGYLASTQAVMNCQDLPPPPPSLMMLDGGGVVAFDQNLPLPPPPPELMSAASAGSSRPAPLRLPQLDSGFATNGKRHQASPGAPTSPPAPPVRSTATRLSVRGVNPRARCVIRDLDRVMTQKHEQGADGLSNLEIPLPPPPPVSSEDDYLDVDPFDLPPPPAEILQSLKSMRNRPLPPVPTSALPHRPAFPRMA